MSLQEKARPRDEQVLNAPIGGCEPLISIEHARQDEVLSGFIATNLGYSPDALQFDTYPENHVITRRLAAHVICGDNRLLMGEMYPGLILERYTADLSQYGLPVGGKAPPLSWRTRWSRMLNPAFGASLFEKNLDATNVQRLINHGIGLVSCDDTIAEHYKVYEGTIPDVDRVMVMGASFALLLGLSAGAAATFLSAERLPQVVTDRRGFIRLACLGGAAAVASYIGYTANSWYEAADWTQRALTPGRSQALELKADRQIDFEKLLVELGLDDDPFGTFSEVVVPFRDNVMALNAWQTLAEEMYGKNKVTNATMFYGTWHGKIYDRMMEGFGALETNIREYAKRFLNETYEYMFEQNAVKLGLKDVLEELAYENGLASEGAPKLGKINSKLVSAFSSYVRIFADSMRFDKNDPGLIRIPADYRLPLSAKTIFVDELKGEIRRLGECSTRISECKRETLVQIERAMWQQRLAHLIVSGKKIHKNILSKKEQSMLNDPEIAVAYQQVAADYNAEIERQKGSSAFAGNGTYYVKQFTTLGDDIGDIGRTNIGTNFLILGWAKVRGHYAPVIRETFDTIGMVHSKDTMYISANERVALGRYYYDKIDSAREFYEMPFVEDYLYQYVNFKPGTVNDLWLRRNDYNEAFRNGKMYKLRDGQVDPFNVNLLEIGERVSMPIG